MKTKEMINEAKHMAEEHLNGHHKSSFINGKSFFTFLAGAAVGVGVGIYLASDAGKELREQLSERFSGLNDKIKDTVETFSEKFGDMASNVTGDHNQGGGQQEGAQGHQG
ncbi:MAG: YtxH domain-containing protein [Chitinophagales bacterium]|nr:YtxH domain-containing protein [Chitinophagales bacterium]